MTLTGTATEDETLTATVTDADGLPDDAANIRYRWQRSDGSGGFDEIPNATSQSYNLGDEDVGREVRVLVNYIDGNGTVEALTSASTTAVTNINDVPTGGITISGQATEDQTLTAQTDTLDDADGLGTLNYQWQRSDGSGDFENIANATGETYTLGDADVGREVQVVVSYTDGNNTAESLNLMPTAEVGTANIAPTGGVRIDGTVRQGQQLSADISAIQDADGLPDGASGFSYQWQRTGADGTFADIENATEQTYTVAMADVGQRLQVVVRYTDGNDTNETLTAATVSAAVSNADDPVIDEANIQPGTAGNDRLFSDPGRQRLNGFGGDDFLRSGADADILDGGDGADGVSYSSNSADIEINLETGTATGGTAEGDVLIGIENITSGSGNDIITGNNKDNDLLGIEGNDTLDGRAGNDLLNGWFGDDSLIGGEGDDQVFGGLDDDRLDGGDGNDLLDGEWGDDILTGCCLQTACLPTLKRCRRRLPKMVTIWRSHCPKPTP